MAPDPGLNCHFDAAVPILAEGRVAPFLGAGVNCAGRNPGARWSEGGEDLPDALELARWLADMAGISGHEADLLRNAQILETLLGRGGRSESRGYAASHRPSGFVQLFHRTSPR